MEIIIKGEAKEIAALVMALREQKNDEDIVTVNPNAFEAFIGEG